MVLGDRDLLLIFEFFTTVMYGESRGNWAKKPCRQVLPLFQWW